MLFVLQARLCSTRLPRKVLLPLPSPNSEKPLLWHVINRVKSATKAWTQWGAKIIAAAGEDSDEIRDICDEAGAIYFHSPMRHINDVLGRYVDCMNLFEEKECVVRVTSDCPLIFPSVIRGVIGHFLIHPDLDVVAADVKIGPATGYRKWPDGTDVEAIYPLALTFANDILTGSGGEVDYFREHVTPYLYRSPHYFRTYQVRASGNYGSVKLSVDTQEEYELVRSIYQAGCDGQLDLYDVEKVTEWAKAHS